ncbi:hypothetical protein FHR32_001023 [Streptosporangium album]|uniref:Uncharacterized protein n=1 Tax=Streptosporangium album TaxID=47479 RepID=A0A7W7W7D7_9ACTN|nr:hypothetical protein [Streptosporangium album]MBB4936718.1 hypothetical protein [Streptosporangium album]
MLLGPVVSDEQHPSLQELDNSSSSLQEPVGDLMDKCSRHAIGGHDIPSAIKTPDHR